MPAGLAFFNKLADYRKNRGCQVLRPSWARMTGRAHGWRGAPNLWAMSLLAPSGTMPTPDPFAYPLKPGGH
jgi:hypothetical protein